ncbi:Ldh family oxidoreductase [Paenibacillus silviterrae]|uniref:Ldh family oxidoreductase n=1 Tax=Paenibacillus silviterrae TaxID=3242194 RepID=UPI002542B5CD|nr:Ldh family oxidoreductase [Paenibacillus chinjuensis]
MGNAQILVPRAVLEAYVRAVFAGAGLEDADAAIIARHLTLANMRGVESHGVSRVDIYTRRLEAGLESKKLRMSIEKETDSSLLIHGGHSLGILLATKGMELAVAKAKATGIAVVGIKHSAHCGMLADYAGYAAEHDCIAFATTNAPAYMAPWGGKRAYFGTNPLCYAVPAGEEPAIVFDMATSMVARGKLVVAQQNGQSIPLGWAIAKDGKPTTDPAAALSGGLVLPLGGAKGYGLAVLVDILSGLFTGAAFGPYIGHLYDDLDRNQEVGQFFWLMRADLFEDLAVFKGRVDRMIREVRLVPLAEGFERIYLPGEIEQELAAKRERNGIPLGSALVKELQEVGKKYGVASPF